MIEQARGNLLEAEVEALVNTVNTEGVMGKGVALQFKKALPEMFAAYREACKQGQVVTGKMHVFERLDLFNPRFIINFPTKRRWRDASRLEDIQLGLPDLVRVVRQNGITSIAIPALGCGLGGLCWSEVFPMIQQAFSDLPDVRVLMYQPQSIP